MDRVSRVFQRVTWFFCSDELFFIYEQVDIIVIDVNQNGGNR